MEADIACGLLATTGVPGLDLRERIVLAWRPDKVYSKLQRCLMEQIRRELEDQTDEARDVESNGK
ncbi:hypothetical protein ACQP1K_18640 [Sphaerimonospora sp. CA-214678]|uniref:hypothetical protein n=1 Tax=Sphaerimonospora sp. CA-214678 TaxID=3240029 RepID=UPI003D91A62B